MGKLKKLSSERVAILKRKDRYTNKFELVSNGNYNSAIKLSVMDNVASTAMSMSKEVNFIKCAREIKATNNQMRILKVKSEKISVINKKIIKVS